MPKFPCGICGRGVRSGAIFCNGDCNLWYHFKCLNMNNAQQQQIINNNKTNVWKCQNCNPSSTTDSKGLEDLKEKFTNINFENELDINSSLTIAAEAGSLLLQENDNLKQQIYDLENDKSNFELETENRVTQLQEKIHLLIEAKNKMEEDYLRKIEGMHKKTRKDTEYKNKLISQLEDDKLMYMNQVKDYNQQLENLKSKTDRILIQEWKKETEVMTAENNRLKLQITELTNQNLHFLKVTEELKQSQSNLYKEVQTKNKIIELLLSDCLELKNKVLISEPHTTLNLATDSEAPSFQFPKRKNTFGPVVEPDNMVRLTNRFSPLSLDDSVADSGTVIQVTAEVHHQPSSTTMTRPRTFINSSNRDRSRPQVLVLSDSHGKGLYNTIDNCLQNKYKVMVLTKSNAKFKHIVREGLPLAKNFTKKDYVIIIAGTNDLNRNEPAQLTTHQGLTELFCWKVETNVIIVEVPYRYNDSYMNENISYINSELKRKIENYSGILNLNFLEINSSTQRHFYTRHGLHFNRTGKTFLSGNISDTINRLECNSAHSNKKQIHRVWNNTQKLLTPRQIHTPVVRREKTDRVQHETSEIENFPDNSLYEVSPTPTFYQLSEINHTDNENTSFFLPSEEFPPLGPRRTPGGLSTVSDQCGDNFLNIVACREILT